MTSLSYHYKEMRAKDGCLFVHVIYWRWEGGFQLSPAHTHTCACLHIVFSRRVSGVPFALAGVHPCAGVAVEKRGSVS